MFREKKNVFETLMYGKTHWQVVFFSLILQRKEHENYIMDKMKK